MPLSLQVIVFEIAKIDPEAFTGKSPTSSLYSIVYRREKRRLAARQETQFICKVIRGGLVYSINPKYEEI